MANPIHPKSGYEKWQDSIRLARCNPKWADHDVLIKQTVKAFNEHLKATPGYASLDWQLIKAML